MRGRQGFTLIELLVVVAIMAALASIGLPMSELVRKRQQESELRMALRDIRTAIDKYKALSDVGAIGRAADGSGYPPNLLVLEEGVRDLRSPNGAKIYLLRKLPRDPFAPSDITAAADTWQLRSYASSHQDPRPGADVFDVASKSPASGLNGMPYRAW